MPISKINKCITPEMESFLEAMTEIAKDYTVKELNEYLETENGQLKLSITKAKDYLIANIGAQDIRILENQDNNYNITFFVGERNSKRKYGYIINIAPLP